MPNVVKTGTTLCNMGNVTSSVSIQHCKKRGEKTDSLKVLTTNQTTDLIRLNVDMYQHSMIANFPIWSKNIFA